MIGAAVSQVGQFLLLIVALYLVLMVVCGSVNAAYMSKPDSEKKAALLVLAWAIFFAFAGIEVFL